MEKQNDKIEYLNLTQEDMIEYKQYGKRRLKMCAIFCAICFPIFLISAIELSQQYSAVWIIIAFIIYILGVFSSYIIRFAGKPVGVRYGKISKTVYVRQGKYSAYKFNIYFEDIDKSLFKVNVVKTKQHPTPRLQDKVKVFKSRFGALYIVVSD